MNKKETLKLKPGLWLEVRRADGALAVALTINKPFDMGAGFNASVRLLCDGEVLSIPQDRLVRVLGVLEVPALPLRLLTATEVTAADVQAARFAKRNADSTKAKPKSKRSTPAPDFGTVTTAFGSPASDNEY